MRKTFSHESDRDRQIGDKIRTGLQSESTVDDAVGKPFGTEAFAEQSNGFETPKAVSACLCTAHLLLLCS